LPARKLVIVLDDEISVLKGLERLLTAYGFDTELLCSVQEFQDCAKLDQAICLVLDINLNGKSGIEVRRQLAITNPGLPVVFITANDSEGTRRAARDVGCSAYLPKPFLAKSLINAIEKASAEALH
jgi:FixJ family two-component response regulator